MAKLQAILTSLFLLVAGFQFACFRIYRGILTSLFLLSGWVACFLLFFVFYLFFQPLHFSFYKLLGILLVNFFSAWVNIGDFYSLQPKLWLIDLLFSKSYSSSHPRSLEVTFFFMKLLDFISSLLCKIEHSIHLHFIIVSYLLVHYCINT